MNGSEMNGSEQGSEKNVEADFQSSLIDAVRRADRTGANVLIDSWAAHYGYEHLFANVLEPVLEKIGEEWRASETFSIAQAYVAAKIAEDVLVKAAEHKQLGQPPQPAKGTVVVGNIEEDFHGLGRIGVFKGGVGGFGVVVGQIGGHGMLGEQGDPPRVGVFKIAESGEGESFGTEAGFGLCTEGAGQAGELEGGG